MIPFEYILLIISILVLISIALWKLSENLGVPSLLLFLAIGMLAGSDGIGKIYFDNVYAAQSIGIVALIFILFSGGLDTKWKTVKPVVWSAISLSTLGIVITAVVIGYAVHKLLGFSIYQGLLIGAIISSTDAAAVFSTLGAKQTRLKGKIKPLIELESGSNDPAAIILTIVFLQIVLTGEAPILNIIGYLILQIVIGGAAGYFLGRLMVLLMNKLKFTFSGLYPVFAIAFAVLIYAVTTAAQGSGILAVYIASIVIGNSEFVQKKSLIRYFDSIALLGQIIMFLTLGLLVFPSQLFPIAGIGMIISLILIFIARPAGVFISLIFSQFKFNEKVFVSWVGLRGAVPIILATFPLAAKLNIGNDIFNIVFFCTLTSALLQGWSIPFAAKLLKVSDKMRPDIKMPIELTDVKSNNQLIDIIIPYDSEAAGKTLAELKLPSESLITVICRDEEYIVPNGSTALEAGDAILVLVNDENLQDVKNVFGKLKKKK